MVKKLEEKLILDPNITEQKRETLVDFCEKLLNYGYEPSFIAGILGNIKYEGCVGLFENSFYRNKTRKPAYLKNMEKYDYDKKYSLKYIYDDFSLFELRDLLEELKINKFTARFGLGAAQWTGNRTYRLMHFYLEETGLKEKISKEQTTSAEMKLLLNELIYDEEYNKIYPEWKEKNKNLNTEDAAYNAGVLFCKGFEKPKVDKSKERGNESKKLYNFMIS